MTLRDRVNPHILDLKPYQPGKPIEELERELGIHDSVKLASNEHPVGASARVLEAIRSCVGDVHLYPDGASFDLRARLAKRLGVDPSQFVFGNGSSEVLELLAKTLLGPGDRVVYPWPSFAMYPLVVQGMGAEGVAVALNAALEHDLPAMLGAIDSSTKMVLICNPNNPTGASIGATAFDGFMEKVPADVVVVVDEAYAEFALRDDFPDVLGWIARRPATIMLRTFSKVYGLGGLRVGYGVAGAELADYLQRARHPFNVNRVAEVAAVAALEDTEYMASSVRANTEGRAKLGQALVKMGYEVWPSDANFLLVRIGSEVYEPLLRQGVIVRPMDGFGLKGCIRITVGTPAANERVVAALQRIREEGA